MQFDQRLFTQITIYGIAKQKAAIAVVSAMTALSELNFFLYS